MFHGFLAWLVGWLVGWSVAFLILILTFMFVEQSLLRGKISTRWMLWDGIGVSPYIPRCNRQNLFTFHDCHAFLEDTHERRVVVLHLL